MCVPQALPQNVPASSRPSMVMGRGERPWRASIFRWRSARSRRSATETYSGKMSPVQPIHASLARDGAPQVQGHEPQELPVVQLGEPDLARPLQELARELLLLLQHGVDPPLDRAPADQLVYQHAAGLADAEGAV